MTTQEMTDLASDRQQRPADRSARQSRELLRRMGKLTEAQAAMGWGIILLIITLLGTIYLSQSSRVAATGRHVQQLEFDLSALRQANSEIERDIAEAQSIARLYEATIREGFVPSQATDIEYLIIPNYPDMAPAPQLLNVEPDRPSEPLGTMREALSIVVRDRLDDLMRGESGE